MGNRMGSVWSRCSVRKKISYSTLFATAVLVAIFVAVTAYRLRSSQERAQWRKGVVLAAMTGENIKSFIQVDQTDSILRGMEGLAKDGDVTMGLVIGIDENKAVQIKVAKTFGSNVNVEPASLVKDVATGRLQFEAKGYRVVASPLKDGGQEIECLTDPGKKWYQVVVMNTIELDRQVGTEMVTLGILGLVMMGFSFAASSLIGRAIVRPLVSMQASMENIAEGDGDLTIRLEVHGEDEVGKLSQDFNTFVDNIQRIVQQVISISANIASGSLQVSAGMTEMASTAESIAQSAEQQKEDVAQSTEKVSAIALSSENINGAVKEAQGAFGKAEEAGTQGDSAVKAAVAGMKAIEQSSQQIGRILTAITEIANQTNLLSLNAAIEAAKAGEHGKGFAVVAEEVRKLADRSAHAAKEITSLIQSSERSIQDGTKMVNAAGSSLESISEAILASAGQMKGIGVQSESQTADSGQVVEAMNRLSSIAEQNAASTEEMAATISETTHTVEELSRLAENLKTLASRFKV